MKEKTPEEISQMAKESLETRLEAYKLTLEGKGEYEALKEAYYSTGKSGNWKIITGMWRNNGLWPLSDDEKKLIEKQDTKQSSPAAEDVQPDKAGAMVVAPSDDQEEILERKTESIPQDESIKPELTTNNDQPEELGPDTKDSQQNTTSDPDSTTSHDQGDARSMNTKGYQQGEPDGLGSATNHDQGKTVAVDTRNAPPKEPAMSPGGVLEELVGMIDDLRDMRTWWVRQRETGGTMTTLQRPTFKLNREKGKDGRKNTGVFLNAEILELAVAKAKSEHMSFSQLVEFMLWKYLGEPKDLVEKPLTMKGYSPE